MEWYFNMPIYEQELFVEMLKTGIIVLLILVITVWWILKE